MKCDIKLVQNHRNAWSLIIDFVAKRSTSFGILFLPSRYKHGEELKKACNIKARKKQKLSLLKKLLGLEKSIEMTGKVSKKTTAILRKNIPMEIRFFKNKGLVMESYDFGTNIRLSLDGKSYLDLSKRLISKGFKPGVLKRVK